MENFLTANAKRMMGVVTATEVGNNIRVEGINTYVMAKDIANIWRTNRIKINMFSYIGTSHFIFPSFFALDILFMIEQMIQTKDLRSSVRTLTRIRDALLENTWLSSIRSEYFDRLNYSKLKDLTVELREHQMKLLKDYAKITAQYRLKGYLFAAAPGLGKTIGAIALNECLENDVCVVVAPKVAIIDVWVKTIKTESIFRKPPPVWNSVEQGPLTGNEKYIIIHYEYIPKFLEQIRLFKGKKANAVLDESHNLNNLKANRTENFYDLCVALNCMDSLWLSGTPIKALAGEAASILRCIDPRFTENALERFKKIYAGSTGAALDILQHRINTFTLYVEKAVLNLKPPILQDIKILTPNAQEYTLDAIYKKMVDFTQERLTYYAGRKKEDEQYFWSIIRQHEKSLRSESQKLDFEAYLASLKNVIKSGNTMLVEDVATCSRYENTQIIPYLSAEDKHKFRDIRSIIKYVKVKIQGECLGRIVGGARIQCHIDMAKYIDYNQIVESTSKKCVFFTSYVEVLQTAEVICKNKGLSPLTAYAANSNKLPQTVSSFYKDDDANPLIATYRTLSTAVPLTAADVAVMMDAPWRDYILQQAISRIHRDDSSKGHVATQVYVYMCSLDTGEQINISTRSFDILKWSQQMMQEITGIRSPYEIKQTEDGGFITTEDLSQSTCQIPSCLDW